MHQMHPDFEMLGESSAAHTVRLEAVDALGQVRSDSFGVRVDAVAPTSTSDGDLLSVSQSALTEDTYHLRVEARDNSPEPPEVNDDGTEVTPTDSAGTGLKDLVVRLDGESVTTTSTSCFDDASCEQARSWTWDLAGVGNGVHTITITAADKVGNQDVDGFQVDVQRRADEPARSNGSIRRNVLGAAGLDRTGHTVAAVGDVNADGHSDYLVGAPGVTASGRLSAGAAYIVFGSSDTSTLDLASRGGSAVRILGPGATQYCGTSVAAAGDVNGDGLNDMLIGCPGVDPRIGALSATGRVPNSVGREVSATSYLGAPRPRTSIWPASEATDL